VEVGGGIPDGKAHKSVSLCFLDSRRSTDLAQSPGLHFVDEPPDRFLARMKGDALMRAIDCLTSFSRSENASAAHSGLIPVSCSMEALNASVGEREHPAVGVVDEDDLLGPEQAL